MRKKITIIFVLVSMLTFSQKIEQSKNELKTNKSKSSHHTAYTSTNNVVNHHFNSGFQNLVVELFLYIGYYSIIGSSKYESHLNNQLSKYPFCDKNIGNYTTATDSSDCSTKIRLDVENHFLIKNIREFANHTKLKIRPFKYGYLQLNYHELMEKNFITNDWSNLSLYHFVIGYDRLRFKRFNLGWNIGASYVGNNVRKAGLCVGVNADAFATDKISFSAAALWSSINQQPVNTFEIRGKYHLKKYFVSLGFEGLKIANPMYTYTSIGGGVYF